MLLRDDCSYTLTEAANALHCTTDVFKRNFPDCIHYPQDGWRNGAALVYGSEVNERIMRLPTIPPKKQ